MAALAGDKPICRSRRSTAHPAQIKEWKSGRAGGDGGEACAAARAEEGEEKPEAALYEQIGRLKMDLDFLSRKLAPRKERLGMIEKDNSETSVRRQCLLSLSRASVYYEPRPASDLNERLMRRLDELYTAHPFLAIASCWVVAARGARRQSQERAAADAAFWLAGDLSEAGHQQAASEASDLPVFACYPRITGPNQVWGDDITYIRLGQALLFRWR